MSERDDKWLGLRSGERPVLETSRPSEISEVVARYKFADSFCRDKVVLDVGCGAGFGTVLLANMAKKVIGVDVSPEAVDYARTRFSKGNLDFMQALRQLSIDYPGRVGFYYGYLPDPHEAKIYRRTFICGDLGISLSTFEPFGLLAVEYFAFGVPCLATHVGGQTGTVKTTYVPGLSEAIEVREDEQDYNGIRVPLNLSNFDETLDNAIKGFDFAYNSMIIVTIAL